MENIEKIQISCPKCKEINNYQLPTSVNVSNGESSKEDIISGKFFIKECKKCGTKMTIEYPFIYHDSFNKFMIYFFPEINSEHISRINNQLKVNENIDDEIEVIYALRIVEDLETFKEKINIFENGKNDITLELYKTLIISSLKDSHPNFIPYDIIYTEEDKLLVYGENDQTITMNIINELYEKLQDDINEIISDSIGKGFLQIDATWVKDKFYN